MDRNRTGQHFEIWSSGAQLLFTNSSTRYGSLCIASLLSVLTFIINSYQYT